MRHRLSPGFCYLTTQTVILLLLVNATIMMSAISVTTALQQGRSLASSDKKSCLNGSVLLCNDSAQSDDGYLQEAQVSPFKGNHI